MKKFNKLVAVSSAALLLVGVAQPAISSVVEAAPAQSQPAQKIAYAENTAQKDQIKNDLEKAGAKIISVVKGQATQAKIDLERAKTKEVLPSYYGYHPAVGQIFNDQGQPFASPGEAQAAAQSAVDTFNQNHQDQETPANRNLAEGLLYQAAGTAPDGVDKKTVSGAATLAEVRESQEYKTAIQDGFKEVNAVEGVQAWRITYEPAANKSEEPKPAPEKKDSYASKEEAVKAGQEEINKLPEADRAKKDLEITEKGGRFFYKVVDKAAPKPGESKPSESKPGESKPEPQKTPAEKKIEAIQDFVKNNPGKFKDYRIVKDSQGNVSFVVIATDGKAYDTIFNDKYELSVNKEPRKNNQHDNLPEIKADRNKESGLVNYYPTAAQAEAQAKQLNAENPDMNHYIVQMTDGQFYVASEPKLLTVRDVEREAEESIKYASQDAANKAGERLKGIYKNLGYEIKHNEDGTYSLKLIEEIQKPAEKNTKFFNSVHDAERHAEKQVGKDQYYVIQKTVDGKYIVRYYPKTGIRPYEEREIAGKRFANKADADAYGKSLSRRYLNAKYTVEVDPKTGEYMVKFEAAKETGSALKGENAEQKAGEKSPAATDTSGAKKEAASDKAKLPETGEAKGFAAFGAAALALLAGLGLVAPRFKKED